MNAGDLMTSLLELSMRGRTPRDKDVLCLRDAAAVLAISPEVLLGAAESGEVPGKKFGDQWRFSRAALRKCLAQPKDPLLCMLDSRGIKYEVRE